MPVEGYLRERPGDQAGCSLAVRVQPGAKQTAILGHYDEGQQLKIALKAPPVDGRANQELIRYLAGLFSIPQSRITIVHGQAGRSKLVALSATSLAEAQAVLAALL